MIVMIPRRCRARLDLRVLVRLVVAVFHRRRLQIHQVRPILTARVAVLVIPRARRRMSRLYRIDGRKRWEPQNLGKNLVAGENEPGRIPIHLLRPCLRTTVTERGQCLSLPMKDQNLDRIDRILDLDLDLGVSLQKYMKARDES